jgi:hypothetical protein
MGKVKGTRKTKRTKWKKRRAHEKLIEWQSKSRIILITLYVGQGRPNGQTSVLNPKFLGSQKGLKNINLIIKYNMIKYLQI